MTRPPARSIDSWAVALLWTLRLSPITSWPGVRAGTSICHLRDNDLEVAAVRDAFERYRRRDACRRQCGQRGGVRPMMARRRADYPLPRGARP